ncbi:hypothetical protein G9A89_016011 [Geosiphon pyriformis]|nr:hypothetical protein G9A89_016011 [Geosiphon pyriformis]
MAVKAKNSKKQQQAVATAMMALNPFVVPDKILEKISTVAVSSFPNMDEAKQSITLDDLKDWANQIKMESTALLPVSSTADGSAWENLLPGCIGLKSVSQDAIKLFCMKFASQKSLNGAIKVAIGEEVFLITLKIVWSSGVASVSFPPLSVALCDVFLGDNIKAALGIFDISSAAETLKHWSVLVIKDSVRIFSVVNQREVIASRDVFKVKLVNLSFGCTAFKISNLVSQTMLCQKLVPYVIAVSCKKLLNAVTATGVKSSFTGAKSYVKAVAFVVPLAAAGINLVLDSTPKVVIPMVSDIFLVLITVVESRLVFMKSHLNELALLVKFIIEPVGSLVVLVTKLLSTPPAVDITLRKSVVGLERQVKAMIAVAFMLNRDVKSLTKKCDWISLEDVSNNNNMDNNDNKVKNFSVYNDTFDMIMQLDFWFIFLPLAGGSSPVKVFFKRHTWVNFSVVSTTSKSPKIFNNKPVNKLVFPTLTTPITTITTTASQMIMNAKNSKKQQQAVTTAMVTPNHFVVLDKILDKISTTTASSFSDKNGNNNGISPRSTTGCTDQMEMESTVPPPVFGVVNDDA